MIWSWVRFILGTACLIFGLFFIVSSVVGNFKFKFALNRMHSAALGDTLGLLGIVVGTCIYHGLNVTTLKLLAIVALVWITSPVASHLLMLMELSSGRYTEEIHEEPSDEQGLERYTVDMKRNAIRNYDSDKNKDKGENDK